MTTAVETFLTRRGVPGTILKHAKEKTIQDYLDEMTPAQKDAQAVVVAAALENQDLSGAPEVIKDFMTTSGMVKMYTAFVVGNTMSEMSHSGIDDVDEFLAHHGVKGMKWGVIRDNLTGNVDGAPRLSSSSNNTAAGRAMARAKVKGGSATLGEAHLAALKSTGHRAINAVSGDKQFWKSAAITVGVAGTVAATAVLVPPLLPASWMASVGAMTAANAGATVIAGHAMTTSGAIVSTSAIGVAEVAKAGVLAAYLGGGAALSVSARSNTRRALLGNNAINNSYARLGNQIKARQTAGTERINRILRMNGSLRKKDLQHGVDLDISLEEMQHALEAGSGGKGGGGKRKFDESKVKRDGGGQFSRQAFNKGLDDDTRTPAQIDADWKSNIGRNTDLLKAVWGKKSPLYMGMTNKINEIKKRTGVDLSRIPTRDYDSPEITKAATELMTYVATTANKVLASSPAAVSPSKTQRVQLRVVNAGTKDVDFEYVYVPNRLKHSNFDAASFLHALEAEEGQRFGGLKKLLEMFETDSDEENED